MDYEWRQSFTCDYDKKVKIVKKGYPNVYEVRQGNYHGFFINLGLQVDHFGKKSSSWS